jgi:hypothetical protein
MKHLTFFLFAFVATSCATLSPAGNWNFAITGTPQGDFTGSMEVTKKDAGYAAKLKIADTEAVFERFTFDKKTAKSTGTFYYQSMGVNFDAAVAKEAMDGTVSVQGMSFPFKASRQK